MFAWLKKNDWKKSHAHLLLLSKFLHVNSEDWFIGNERWKGVLNEEPEKAIDQFIKDKAIERATLFDSVSYQFTVSALKLMARENGLKISGRKDELVNRLIDHDEIYMKNLSKNKILYICTDSGKKIAENYLLEKEIQRKCAINKSFKFISKKDFFSAIDIVARYESSQVFQRGIGIDWSNIDKKQHIDFLRVIFTKKPAILKNIENDILNKLQVAAAMMHLWGTPTVGELINDNYESGIYLDKEAACRMIIFYASHALNLSDYKLAGFRKIKINCVEDMNLCDECKKINNAIYCLDNAPELPYEKCTCSIGCRCSMTAIDF